MGDLSATVSSSRSRALVDAYLSPVHGILAIINLGPDNASKYLLPTRTSRKRARTHNNIIYTYYYCYCITIIIIIFYIILSGTYFVLYYMDRHRRHTTRTRHTNRLNYSRLEKRDLFVFSTYVYFGLSSLYVVRFLFVRINFFFCFIKRVL